MQPGQTIEIQLVDNSGRSVRLGNVLPRITLFNGGHRYYAFDLRPTECDGRILVEFDHLETRRLENGLYSLMDFNVPLTALDPDVQISISSETELQTTLQGIKLWNSWCQPAWIMKWPVNGCLGPVTPVRVVPEGPFTHVDIVVSLPL